MKKRKGGIIFYLIFIIVAILIIVLIFFSNIWKEKNAENKDNTENKQEQVDLVKLGEEYKNKIKDILPTYEEVVVSMNKEKIEELREQLLGLKMPAEFRDAHVELVLLLDKIEQNVATKELQNKFNEIVNKYDWLKESQ